jgi:hypothetical protein
MMNNSSDDRANAHLRGLGSSLHSPCIHGRKSECRRSNPGHELSCHPVITYWSVSSSVQPACREAISVEPEEASLACLQVGASQLCGVSEPCLQDWVGVRR